MPSQMPKKSVLVLTLLAIVALSIYSTTTQAKDLTNRLGVGVKSHETLNLPELAVVYNPMKDIEITGGLGIDTKKDESKFAANAGVRRIIFKEDNMNFYMGGIFGLLSEEVAGSKESGVELDAVFGGEFFLPGLDSLAFTFEGGAGVISAKNVRFRTIADSPLRAGIIFYF